MALNTEEKAQIVKKFALHEGDTGSPEVQIALLSKQIEDLSEHLKIHKKTIIHEEVYFKWSEKEGDCFSILKIMKRKGIIP